MHHYSIFELFNIGIGPSSSHTVGPMRAAGRFLEQIRNSPHLDDITGIRCECYGSLAATGHGHGTDTAIMLGLMGEEPQSVVPREIPKKIAALHQHETLVITEGKSIRFSPSRDVDLSHYQPLHLHPNGMLFTALDQNGNPVEDAVFYSTGGGFVASEQEMLHPDEAEEEPFPLPYASAEELLHMADERHCSISAIVMANECSRRTEAEVRDHMDSIWQTMKQSIAHGMSARGTLPGVLQVPRRAKTLRKSLLAHGESALKDPLSIMDWITLYAIAVSEENAAGGRIVTAPTNGAAGILPAVLNYASKFCFSPHPDSIHRFLLTAGGIAILYKKNASISGADVGCQGEVGVACSMAAAALAEYMGGTPHQVENAAEIGMEHNLGLTCDPIAGLVQIPCIERNAIAAVKAINAARLALGGTGAHFVPLDKVIRTMLDTGRDMQSKYKETAQGGLAVNVVNC